MKFKLSSTYYMTILLILLNNWLSETKFLQGVYENFKYLVIIIIFVSMMLQFFTVRYSFKRKILFLGLLSMCIYTSYTIKSTWLIYLFIVLVFCKNNSIETTMKIISNCLIWFFAINFVAFILMYLLAPNMVPVLYTANKVRWSINFLSPNNAARNLIFLVLSYSYCNYNSKDNKSWILIFFITVVVYILTKSDALFLIPLIFFLMKSKNSVFIRLVIKKFSKYGFILIWFFSYISIFFQDNRLFIWLNSLSTGRLTLGARGLEVYGSTLFGNNVTLGTYININDFFLYMGVDNAYLYFMIHTGIFYLVMISIIFLKANPKLNYKSNICIAIYIIYAVFENNIIVATSFFPIIIAVDAIINKNLLATNGLNKLVFRSE